MRDALTSDTLSDLTSDARSTHPSLSPPHLSDTPLPKYYRVKEMIARRLASGEWGVGAAIPPEPELCKEFGVSRITVRKAIGDLVHEGKLYTIQGKGTFVAERKLPERFAQRAFGLYEDMKRRGLELETRVLRQAVTLADEEVARALQLSPGAPVHIIVRLRSVGGEKLLLSTTYAPQALCPDLGRDDLTSGSLYSLLATRYGLSIARGERSIEAVAAGEWEAALLDVNAGSPLLRLDSVAYLADGRPFEYSHALQRGDRARIEVEFIPSETDAL